MMDQYEACSELAQMIKEDKFYDGGLAIQSFIEANRSGETAHMALVMVKQSLSIDHAEDEYDLMDSTYED